MLNCPARVPGTQSVLPDILLVSFMPRNEAFVFYTIPLSLDNTLLSGDSCQLSVAGCQQETSGVQERMRFIPSTQDSSLSTVHCSLSTPDNDLLS
jgi:hypothetical protein